jgi:6-pyruvoyltetrahydropterin/6-carboxytetrahydropterin synthase
VTLTRRYRFSASHRLHSAQLSKQENERVYGKCNNPFGHGHDYVLDVSVTGSIESSTGRIVDLDTLDRLVRERVLGPFEHRNLSVEVPEFKALVPTTENLAVEIDRRLRQAWPADFNGTSPRLEKIRIQETPRNIFEYRHEDE